MKIIGCKYIYDGQKLLIDKAIAFSDKIEAIDSLNNLKDTFPNAEVELFEGNSVLYPGFINPHVHLEFSSNKATLDYNGFTNWLYSVIENRDNLVSSLNSQTIQNEMDAMLQSGITTFGAISSFGAEMQECASAEQRVIFFNEVIGSNPAMIDALFGDFKMRLQESEKLANETFYPAVAIHSPYSVHPILIREVLNIAKEKNLPTTAHFLESQSEREWLESGSGEFKDFFQKFFNTSTPVNTIDGFLELFKNKPTLFTHCTQATDNEFETINQNNHTTIHCPRSNRLLNCGKLDISKPKNLALGTDGLSSNYSLSILDELKSAIFMHTDQNIKELAKELINSITITPAKALNLPIGRLKKGHFADFVIFTLPNDFLYNDFGSVALHTILNCNRADSVLIGGKMLFSSSKS